MRSRTSTWFETKVQYDRQQDDGSEKKVTELYVVDALSFTEAESLIIDEMSVFTSGELKVAGIGKAAYGEVFFSEDTTDDKWYKCKLQFIVFDEEKQKEKLRPVTYLVQAKSLPRAVRYIADEIMQGTAINYDIVTVNETKVMDVYEHHTVEKKEEKNDVPEYEQEAAPETEV